MAVRNCLQLTKGFGVVLLFFFGIYVVKRFIYFDTTIPEVYPCLLHGWTENEIPDRKVVSVSFFFFFKPFQCRFGMHSPFWESWMYWM